VFPNSHFLYRVCAKIKKKFRRQKVNMPGVLRTHSALMLSFRWSIFAVTTGYTTTFKCDHKRKSNRARSWDHSTGTWRPTAGLKLRLIPMYREFWITLYIQFCCYACFNNANWLLINRCIFFLYERNLRMRGLTFSRFQRCVWRRYTVERNVAIVFLIWPLWYYAIFFNVRSCQNAAVSLQQSWLY